MPTTKITDNTKNILKALALKTGKSMVEILEKSIYLNHQEAIEEQLRFFKNL
jgi:hypothetical protein